MHACMHPYVYAKRDKEGKRGRERERERERKRKKERKKERETNHDLLHYLPVVLREQGNTSLI